MRKSNGSFLIGVALLVFAGSASAAIPRTISTQGRLTDAAGTILAGPVNMTFRIYPAGGPTACFTETQTSVPLSGGLFSVAVGGVTTGGIATACDFTSAYELSVQVNTDPEMSPRISLTSNAYAIAASRVGVLMADEVNGRIGIGTVAPRADLDVGGGNSGGALRSVFARQGEGNSTGAGTFLGVKAWGTQPSMFGGKMFSIEDSFYGSTNSSIAFYRGGSTTGGFLTLSTDNDTERMRIDTAGNVGIGTTTPTAKLQVAGNVAATGPFTVSDGTRTFVAGADVNNPWIGTQSNHDLRIISNNAERMRVTAAGNVGIGTTTPSAKLHVVGGDATINGVNIGSVSTGYYGDTGNLAARFPGAAGDFYVQNSGGTTTYARFGAGAGGGIISGNLNVSGAFSVSGPLTAGGSLTVTGNLTAGSGRAVVYSRPAACGGGLTNTTTCAALGCLWNAYGIPTKWLNCTSGACGTVNGTCNTTFVGYVH